MIRGLRAGARGYLLKDTNRKMLFDSLRAAARGEALFLPEVIARVLNQPSAVKRNENSILTDRELEVLQLAARGERSKEIALHLGIAERTVKAHLDSIYTKLGVDSRAAAVATAIERGLLAPPGHTEKAS
jgi:NarL family two-component system response regulator YdfI